ncbi:ProQ/FINO family protein [Nitrincola tibetensis]|nr:ProQ/FinO family protein [Nitrincola tibetensis]
MNTISEKVLSEIEQMQLKMDVLLNECEQRLNSLEQSLSQQESTVERKIVSDSALIETNNGQRKPVSKNRAANLAALQALMEQYPTVFSRESVRPLKIGIQEDLVADDKVSKSKIKRALASYVRSPQYLKSLQEGVDRIGIDASPAGKVTAEEAEHAKGKLKEFHQMRKQRKADQEKEARRKEKEERLSSKLDQLLTLNRQAR